MMPKKAPEIKRSLMIGVKIDPPTKEKIEYLAGMQGEKVSTYIYNLIKKHIDEIEPWIAKELDELKGGIKEKRINKNLLPERAERRRP